MFAILGASGNVGRVTAAALRERGAAVRAIVHDAAKAKALTEIGCEVEIAELRDPSSLAHAIGDAEAVQIILPLAPSSPDPAGDMRQGIEKIAQALEIARPPRILAISDYGAHRDEDIGMPSMFREFEARLYRLVAQIQVLRSAEYMQNWASVIPPALDSGILPSFHDPVDMKFPTISSPDLGRISADLLLQAVIPMPVSVIHAEGPQRYSAANVADALSVLSGQRIEARAVPRAQWQGALESVMPSSLADLLIKANDAQNRGGLVEVEEGAIDVRYGTTALIDALRPLVPLK